MAGQLLDIGQRGPDEVLDTGLPCGPYGSGADLLLSRSLIRFPEIRDDECAVCALECSQETARIEQIRVHHFNISRGERSRGVARRIAARHPYFELALGEQRYPEVRLDLFCTGLVVDLVEPPWELGPLP